MLSRLSPFQHLRWGAQKAKRPCRSTLLLQSTGAAVEASAVNDKRTFAGVDLHRVLNRSVGERWFLQKDFLLARNLSRALRRSTMGLLTPSEWSESRICPSRLRNSILSERSRSGSSAIARR